MKSLDLANDPKARKLFDENLEALTRHDIALAERLRGIETPVSKVVEIDGDRNLDIGHTLFYEKGVKEFVDEQYEAYIADPFRIDMNWPGVDNSPPQIMTRIAMRRINELAKKQKLKRKPFGVQRDITGFAVSIGVGIGDHVDRLLKDHEARSLIVVEQFIDFLWHSMHLHPWHEWIGLVEERGGRVFFILQENAASTSSELTDALRSDNGGTIDGTLIYTHYRSRLVREIHRGLADQLIYIGANRGFFEDENIMILNATQNFLARDYSVWRSRPRREKECPAFVVAAGPSVDGAIETIRKFKDRAVVISCGSGLKVLLASGIKPDFHVEVENIVDQAAILERVASQHSLEGITLVCAATVNPRTAAVFDRVIFFHRDTVCSTRFYELGNAPTYLAVPTVANTGVRLALGMAFREVYLFGIDLGSRIGDYHHSKASGYYTDEEFMFSFQGVEESTKFPFTNEGNFGGTVVTNDGFLLSRLFLQKLCKIYRGFKVYNCSDGVDIPETVPKLPGTVSVTATPENREQAIDLIHKEVETFAKGEGIPLDRFHELREKTVAFYERTYGVLDALEEEKEPNLFDVYARLSSLFTHDSEEEFDHVAAVIWQTNYGTLLTLFSFFFRMYRRIEEKDSLKLYKIFLEELRAFFEDMEGIFLGVIDTLVDEIESQSADAALRA